VERFQTYCTNKTLRRFFPARKLRKRAKTQETCEELQNIGKTLQTTVKMPNTKRLKAQNFSNKWELEVAGRQLLMKSKSSVRRPNVPVVWKNSSVGKIVRKKSINLRNFNILAVKVAGK
jgi:hypothetical protein